MRFPVWIISILLTLSWSTQTMALSPREFVDVGDKKPIRFTPVSLNYANQLFSEIANSRDIAFDVNYDYCVGRAHRVAQKLERKGVYSGKVFLEGNLRALTASDHDGFVEFANHVANAIVVRQKGVDRVMVIDPSFFNQVVTLEEWQRKFSSLPGTKIKRRLFTHRFDFSRPWFDGALGSRLRAQAWNKNDDSKTSEQLSEGLRVQALRRTHPERFYGRVNMSDAEKRSKRGERMGAAQ